MRSPTACSFYLMCLAPVYPVGLLQPQPSAFTLRNIKTWSLQDLLFWGPRWKEWGNHRPGFQSCLEPWCYCRAFLSRAEEHVSLDSQVCTPTAGGAERRNSQKWDSGLGLSVNILARPLGSMSLPLSGWWQWGWNDVSRSEMFLSQNR